MTCNNYVNYLSVASGFQNDPSKAGPLDGLDFSQTYDCSSSSASIKQYVNLMASTAAGCCGGNSGAPESACWVDYSHVCKVPANYLKGHVIPNGYAPNSQTCDIYLQALSVASGYHQGGGAGPLDGQDFSQTYDCSSSSDAIKQQVDAIASDNFGCCGGNSGAPKSTCWTPPRKYILSFLNIHM